MTDISVVRYTLTTYFSDKAEVRAEIAKRSPDDPRHARCIESLQAVAAYISQLPDDDMILVAFSKSGADLFRHGDVFLPPMRAYDGSVESECEGKASACGLEAPISSPAEWFKLWARLVADEIGAGELWEVCRWGQDWKI